MTWLSSLTCTFRSVEGGARILAIAGVIAVIVAGAQPARIVLADPVPVQFLETQTLIHSGKWAEAAIALRKVLENQPRFLPAQLQFSSTLVRLERRAEALSEMTRWVAAEKGERRELLMERIRVYSTLFLTQQGLQSYLDAVNLLNAGKISDARAKLALIADKERDNAEVLLRLGQCFVLENDFDSASEKLHSASQLNSFEPQIRLWLGRALMKRGELTQAVEELRVARESLSRSWQSANWYAEALFLSGQKQAAIEFLEKEVKEEPTHFQSFVMLAKLQLNLSPTDVQALKTAKANLQTALDRHQDYRPDRGLELDLTKKEDLLIEIQGLLQTVETRLERLSSG